MDKTVITEAEKKVLVMSVEAAMKQLAEINAYVSRLRSIEDLAAGGQINLAQMSSLVSPEMKKSLLLGAASKLPHLMYLRNHEDEITDTKEQTQESREKILAYISECRSSIREKEQARAEKVKEYKKAAAEKAASLPDDLPEMLDDLLNADVNKRVRQYNEICLKLYRNQQQIERKLAALEKVNAELIGLYEQSDTDILGLQQKMDHLVELLAALDVPESILDSCVIVDGDEETGGDAE
ncbi:MAG: hypothetical protein IIY28_12170 [Lachnospiraceae bacterium]|nr:hypothetical protein [Lachnospiraceae bacterium]